MLCVLKICAKLVHFVICFFLFFIILQILAVEVEVLGVGIGALVFMEQAERMALPIQYKF
jgi:hypothetical protein